VDGEVLAAAPEPGAGPPRHLLLRLAPVRCRIGRLRRNPASERCFLPPWLRWTWAGLSRCASPRATRTGPPPPTARRRRRSCRARRPGSNSTTRVAAPIANQCAGPYTVQVEDAARSRLPPAAPMDVTLTGRGAGATFADNACATPLTAGLLTVAAGQATASYYFKDGTLEALTHSAGSGGIARQPSPSRSRAALALVRRPGDAGRVTALTLREWTPAKPGGGPGEGRASPQLDGQSYSSFFDRPTPRAHSRRSTDLDSPGADSASSRWSKLEPCSVHRLRHPSTRS